MAAALGHRLRPDYAALVPLLAADPGWGELAGLSLRASLRVEQAGKVLEERAGDLLFTHRGFSGPVALDLSRWLTAPYAGEVELRARWIGRTEPDWESWLRQGGRRTLTSALREELPRRLAARLLRLARVDGERQLAQLPRPERNRLLEALASCPLEVAGSEGYRTAEVTGGGVPLEEVVTRTLESRLVPGLHFAGEILDVTGRLGGFNFLWAWVSGRRAGEAAAAGARAPGVG
jgi:predicted Rossmann fold flavoprotein